MPHYKKRRKRINKKTILLYSGIILVCFLLGGTISFVATRVSTFLQQETKSPPHRGRARFRNAAAGVCWPGGDRKNLFEKDGLFAQN
jgi:hypothetical protein